MEQIVNKVLENSIAEELEIEPGDNILAVNDHPIEDIFDYQYLYIICFLFVLFIYIILRTIYINFYSFIKGG